MVKIKDHNNLISWLLDGDVSIQYQAYRDLLGIEKPSLQKKIAQEGWGAAFLSKRHPDGFWGKGFYQPKWISSHYTLLDLRNLCIEPKNALIKASITKIANEEKDPDGGVNPARSRSGSDVCVNGMFLNYAAYFKSDASELESVVDFLLTQKMADGGFNCRSNRSGARHSSLHSTISVLEGITEYQKNGYTHRLEELEVVKQSSIEFILMHQLFLSDRTGKIIHKDFLRMSYPGRWKYDILRALDYFQNEGLAWDNRMQAALDVLIKKQNKQGSWNLQAKHPGQVHFEMEKAGQPSRMNTLRVLRVLKHFQKFELN